MNRSDLNHRLPAVVQSLVDNIMAEPRMKHLNRVYLPSRDAIIKSIDLLRQLLFPGYYGKLGITTENLAYRIGELTIELTDILYDQVRCCLRYREGISEDNANGNSATSPGGTGKLSGLPVASTGAAPVDNPRSCDAKTCDADAATIVATFFDRIPVVRDLLATDVQAAFDGDPAAQSTDETIFCYPGLFAIFVQRLAHEFYKLGVPLLPRIMTEHAHSRTGIDIHPGAKLGDSFFIDHGTGVVIGETTEIGRNVKLYQGVTLGALAPAFGQLLRGQKRHPTIEDDVTIYAGATILGGDTVIGQGAVIGGNVFITSSVPPLNQVSAEPPKLKYRDRRPKSSRNEIILDFQI
jgi:serine O-acetyltransferase